MCSVARPCPTLGDPMDCSLPGSSVHGIFQVRMGCHFLLLGIFPAQGSSLCLLHWQWVLYHWASRLALLLIGSRFLPLPLFPVSRCGGSWVFTSVLRAIVFDPTDESARGRWRRRSWVHIVPHLHPYSCSTSLPGLYHQEYFLKTFSSLL